MSLGSLEVMGGPASSWLAVPLPVARYMGSNLTSTAYRIGRSTPKLLCSFDCKWTRHFVPVGMRLRRGPQVSLRGLLKLGRIFEDDVVHVLNCSYQAMKRILRKREETATEGAFTVAII